MVIKDINKLNLHYLSEEESEINVSMIPLRENLNIGMYIVRLKDLDKLSEDYNTSIRKLAEFNNVSEDTIAVSCKDEDLLFSNLYEQVNHIVIEPVYSNYYYKIIDCIQECMNNNDITPLLEENPLPYLSSASNLKKDIKSLRKKIFLNKYAKIGMGTAAGVAVGRYLNDKYKKENGESIIESIKNKIASLKLAYHTYNNEYEKAIQTGYKNPGLIKRILETIKNKIKMLINKLSSLIHK